MRQTILLADDSPTIQRLVIQTFADTRFDIVSVNNGDSAVRKFDEIEPDVVLADIYMPGKNGYEVCAHIKSHSSLSDTPVILLVGAFDAFDEATASQAGATGHITKPFEPRALIEMVVSSLPEDGKSRKTAGRDRTRKPPEPVSPASREISAPEPVPDTVATAVEAAPQSVVPAATVAEPATPVPAETGDLLGLEKLFQPEPVAALSKVSAHLSEDEIDRIADRVIQKLSSQIIESIAWDVVPDIAVKIMRDELKNSTHEG
jgi:CheY-like chemotaxis protein